MHLIEGDHVGPATSGLDNADHTRFVSIKEDPQLGRSHNPHEKENDYSPAVQAEGDRTRESEISHNHRKELGQFIEVEAPAETSA